MENSHQHGSWEPIDFTVYFSFIKWWVLSLLVLELAFRFYFQQLASGDLFNRQELIAWLIRIIVFLILGWRSVRSFGNSLAIASISGVCAGLTVGLVVAVSRLFGGLELWKIFNLFTEMILTGLVGAAASLLVALIFHPKQD